MVLVSLLQFIVGLVCLLSGIQLVSYSLRVLASGRIQKFMNERAKGLWFGFGAGLIATSIVQSSSATTVITVSLIDAGVLDLVTAFGIIAGANVGTTITSQIISIDVSRIAPTIIVIGIVFCIVVKGKRRFFGLVFLGFGLVFQGLDVIANSLTPLTSIRLMQVVLDITGRSGPYAIFGGAVFTAIIQSSSATAGIVIALAEEGYVTLQTAIMLIMGSDIGTCMTAGIACLGRSQAAKQGALIHLVFNLIGVIFAATFFPVFIVLVNSTALDIARQVANAHTLFNLVTAGLTIIFVDDIVRLVKILLPE
jgi:phosphate:Na+ symporter